MTEPTRRTWSGPDPQPAPHQPRELDHESDVPQGTSSGDPVVDAAITRLEELDALDLRQHPQAYEDIHDALRSALDGAHQPDPSRS